ncbi:MAG: cytosolic protein [Deltaproteobacteria bacterium]|nr:cytosolic protein [Deltaproteobacteria bacterium]MBW2053152.1 cytosolic protein [Deltaproteobacteria bacterium]MBW2141603.1 cytosolic protein [Deltaproteobacteria bacterium]
MMNENIEKPEDLSQEQLARLILDMLHRIIVHHGLWFVEVEHQMGTDKALEMIHSAFKKSCGIQMSRMSQSLGFEMKDDLPKPLLDLPRESLLNLMDNVAKNWLANDGIWFQTVEFDSGMFDAKRCNDSCWVRFSPFEADSIKQFLGLEKMAGLSGLKKALNFRLYARINKQSIIEESPDSLIFEMNDCRVQAARKRKGLEDYPCKSVGVVEYPYFARTIDSRIKTECIGCPPDDHPEEWYCAWRFTISEEV